ncbi:S41 family peptidase [Gracilibacillus alcaliphilus]|uniref:S41 family peptidase n=1 Tax=Gracilibacillus alcaliphilus TaxID=1401441 RepID=UPI001957EA2E|nr:S41 family peptidase [Gracilibacillus alcaliphilus]MBM7675990.1 carboxyl-terminal processing protease [Gracilibacillus alcaliphilus]
MNVSKGKFILMLILSACLGAVLMFAGVSIISGNFLINDEQGNLANSDQGLFSGSQSELSEQQLENMSKIANAFSIIEQNYVEEVEENQLIEGAIQGMLESLKDPYSVYMDQETMEQFNEQIESSFEGIGTEVSMVDGKVTIIAPIQDTPAEKAGLRPNDQIISVDGESLEGLDVHEAVNKIRGEKGTQVVLEIQRPGAEDMLEIEITRDSIPIETVFAETEEVNGKLIGILRLTSFSEGTASDMEEELVRLEDQGIEGLVIDVRGNPGGLLPAVEEILKNFIPKDKAYMQIEDPTGKKTRYFSDLEEAKEYPVVTIVNEGSASASEILAAALNEAEGYDIVGETSFGKGTVQQTVQMGDGSTIKITTFNWLTPEGNSINEVGVKPTVEQDMPEYYYTNPIQIDEPLVYDQSNNQIANIQLILEGLGYQPERTDGYFNEATREAVEQFQADHDIEVSGEVDEVTAELMQTEIIEKIRDGEDDLQLEKAIEVVAQ